MENNNDVFSFGVDTDTQEDQANNFNYNNLSGLGESNYENEDLFSTEVDTKENNESSVYPNMGTFNSYASNDNYDSQSINFPNYSENYTENVLPSEPVVSSVEQNSYVPVYETTDYNNQNNYYIPTNEKADNFINTEDSKNNEVSQVSENSTVQTTEVPEAQINEDSDDDIFNSQEQNYEVPTFENTFNVDTLPIEENTVSDEIPTEENTLNEDNAPEKEKLEDSVNTDENLTVEQKDTDAFGENGISMSDTPIEQLNKLTEYEEEKIDTTDINELFDKVSVNVKDASDIFKKNTDLKAKIDKRFDELKKLQSEIESSRKSQMDEINTYKEEVLGKLTEKKEEIEKRLNLLKEAQANLEKEKKEFESYKKKEQENIENVQKQVQTAYDERREELNHIESVLRKQKDALDEERSQMSLDKIQYEADKNELANNLLKFNDLVNSFTSGVQGVEE